MEEHPQYCAQRSLNALVELGKLTLPIDIGIIARLYSVSIIVSAELTQGAYGMAFNYNNIRYAAIAPIINTPLQLPLLRYTIAHEIAHHIMGHLLNPWDNSNEVQADEYARSLLIPAAVVNLNPNITALELSHLCCVPYNVARHRLIELCADNIEEYITCS